MRLMLWSPMDEGEFARLAVQGAAAPGASDDVDGRVRSAWAAWFANHAAVLVTIRCN
jgi:hypothetical protein